jgi:hypothetical protein
MTEAVMVASGLVLALPTVADRHKVLSVVLFDKAGAVFHLETQPGLGHAITHRHDAHRVVEAVAVAISKLRTYTDFSEGAGEGEGRGGEEEEGKISHLAYSPKIPEFDRPG